METQKKLLFSIRGFVSDLQIVGNNVYFIAGELNEPDIYRINTDGSGKIALSEHKGEEDKIWQIIVCGDFIYYKKNHGLYKMKLDGSNRVKILDSEDIYELISVEGNKIYFTIWDDLYSVNIDGTNCKKLTSKGDNYIVSNGFVYYTDYISLKETIIKKLSLDTGTETILKKFVHPNNGVFGIIDQMNVYGEWIYYNDNLNNQIRKMKIDGTNDTAILNLTNIEGNITAIHIADDWLFYETEKSYSWVSCKRQLYKVKTDGSLNQKVK